MLDLPRITLPLKRKINVWLHVHFCNDALQYASFVWVRSSDTLVLLKSLWRPLLKTEVYNESVKKDYFLMRLFRIITCLVTVYLQ